ncbi:Monocarboxylate transporter 12 [Lamellibrachia satsuma]|nr:Monocarboxylate transporter 12 [Lamellibrachia satsuma]
MIYIPSVISVTHYFKKRLSLATGLALCGAGIGTIIFAPLVEALMEEYGWRGAVLIEAGLVLNGCIVGTQLRPLEPKKQQQRKPLTDLTERAMNNHSAQNSLSLHSSPHTPAKALEHDDATLRRHGKESGLSGNINADRSSSVAHSHTLTSPHRQEAPQHVYFLFRLCHCSEETKGTFRQLIELLKDMTFILFAISEFFDSLGYYVPYFYLIDMVEQVGISKSNAVFLISVIGVSNLIARVVSGWFSDNKCVNILFLRSSMMMLCGISVSVAWWFIEGVSVSWSIAGVIVSWSIVGATTFLRSIVLVDLLGIERITNSFGLLIFFKGMASFVGAPIAGWIYDMTDSYDIPFVITRAVVTFGGFIQYCIPCARKLRDRRRRRRLDQDNVNTEHGLSLSVMDA